MRYSIAFGWFVALVVLCALNTAVLAQENAESTVEPSTSRQKTYVVEWRITQLNASISGKTSLTEDVGLRDEQGQLIAMSGPSTFFTQAELTIGDMAFKFDQNGEHWDGQKMPTHFDQAKVLTTPMVVTLPDHESAIFVGGTEAFQYMQRQADGRFTLDSVALEVGIKIEFKVIPEKDKWVKLSPLKIQVCSVQDREPIDGVDLNIGKPIVTKEESELDLMVETGRPYGIQWLTHGRGVLLITLKVTEVEKPVKDASRTRPPTSP